MTEGATARVRRFNRSWSQRAGVLDESFLGSGRPIGPSRLLFELDVERPVRDLRDRTGLDSGYVSRLLRRLEDEGLVLTETDPADRRRRLVRLTSAGRQARDDLEARSEKLAAHLLAPLSPGQAERLAAALDTADRLLRSATVDIDRVDPAVDAAHTCLAAYFAELADRFTDGFDPGVDDLGAFREPRGLFLVAVSQGEPIACGGLHDLGQGVSEVKRMWVGPAWRGTGLGGRMLRALEAAALERGARMVRLDTNDTLTDALAMYRRTGYVEIERYNDNPYAQHWFEKSTVGSQA